MFVGLIVLFVYLFSLSYCIWDELVDDFSVFITTKAGVFEALLKH